MKINNETRYDIRDLRKFFHAGLKNHGFTPEQIKRYRIRVVYTRPGEWRREHGRDDYVSGVAYLLRHQMSLRYHLTRNFSELIE